MSVPADTIAGSPNRRFRVDWILVGILVVSLGLRVVLARSGGEGFWGDEELRYESASGAVAGLRTGEFHAAFMSVFSKADHLGYKFFLVPAAYAKAVMGWGDWAIALLGSGIYSVINIAWVYALARRLGAARPEARWAALLVAASNSLFYWSRHFMPYDMALCFGLACLYVGLHPAPTWRQSLLAGGLGFLTFVTYNGYWTIVAAALILHVLRGWPYWKSLAVRAACGLIGLVGPFLLLLFVTSVMGVDLWNGYVEFLGTINQGEFSDGYRVVTDYLWLAERGSFVIWVLFAGLFLHAAWRRTGEDRARAWQWLVVIVAITATLVLFSNLFEVFVVYGRLVRQLVPFLTLLAAWGIAHWCERPAQPRPVWRGIIVTAVLVAGVWNFAAPLRQQFPATFHLRADAFIQAECDRPASVGTPQLTRGRFRIINDRFFWPLPDPEILPPHEVLLSATHPLQFRPYLYEGFKREQRTAFASAPIAMQVILLKD
jgi:hypothetical protein